MSSRKLFSCEVTGPYFAGKDSNSISMEEGSCRGPIYPIKHLRGSVCEQNLQRLESISHCFLGEIGAYLCRGVGSRTMRLAE